jgi:hypothetical protein
MAATEAICFAEPAQLGRSPFRRAGSYLTLGLHPLWRYACLCIAAQLPLQAQEARP